MRDAFESALRDNPDDLAGWCAFADWLTEQGDPLGEFMQTQIALEDEARPKAARDALKAREAELLAAHAREWLGELAPYLLDPADEDDPKPEVQYTWSRGFLAAFDAQCLTVGLGQALASSPAAVLLRELRIRRYPGAYDLSVGGGSAPRTHALG